MKTGAESKHFTKERLLKVLSAVSVLLESCDKMLCTFWQKSTDLVNLSLQLAF